MSEMIFFKYVQRFILSVTVLIVLGSSGCAQQSTAPSHNINTSTESQTKPENEMRWLCLYARFPSDDMVEIVWQGSILSDGGPSEEHHYNVERVDIVTGKTLSNFSYTVPYAPLPQMYFSSDCTSLWNEAKGTFAQYNQSGQIVKEWTLMQGLTSMPQVAEDLSKITYSLEEKRRLVVCEDGGKAILWDSENFEEFSDTSFAYSDFLSHTQVLYVSTTSDHRFYFGIIDLEKPEALPTLLEGKSSGAPSIYGYMLTNGWFQNNGRRLDCYNGEHFLIAKGPNGQFQPKFYDTPTFIEKERCRGVYNGYHSPYKAYEMEVGDGSALVVLDPQGEVFWETLMAEDDSADYPTTFFHGTDISPNGQTVLANVHSLEIHLVTKDRVWTLRKAKER